MQSRDGFGVVDQLIPYLRSYTAVNRPQQALSHLLRFGTV